ncbi:Fc.00g103980.m01.CDS01 [Cosmosporella sp. VM-42]
MNLVWRQLWILTVKDLRIVLYRRWISTPLRAFFLPLLFVVFLCYAKNLFFPPSHYGIGQPRAVRTLSEAVNNVSGNRDRIVFVNSGYTGGNIDQVILDVTKPLRDLAIETEIVKSELDLRAVCSSSGRGSSRCIGAAVFHSSPSEGDGGGWNYTIQTDGSLGSTVHTDASNNDAQIYSLPLQHAIDFAIASNNATSSKDYLSTDIYEYPFTSESNDEHQQSIREQYMRNIVSILGVAFYLSMVGVLYQLAGVMATEREVGMAQLLDTMMPNRTKWQPQAVRLLSHNLAFVFLYGPGWIAMGAVMGAMAFRHTFILVPIVSIVVCGLSLTAFGIFSGSCFRKAQLSGITSVILSLVLAIIAQVSGNGQTWLVTLLSLFFPPMNFIYLIILIARWESRSRAASLVGSIPESHSNVPVVVFWVFALLHAISYPVLGALVERKLYGTTSSSRKTELPGSPVAVRLNRFTKIYQPPLIQRIISNFNKKSLASIHAAQDLNLEALRGEILVLLGANGSGKSTTLDAIAGMHSASAGEILLSYDEFGGKLGHCPQKNVLWDELTVAEHVNIFDGIKNTGPRSSATRIMRLIEACDLGKKKKTWANALSGGQKRKLQLALMFVGDSTICCVDEVSSGVDPLSRRKLWDILLTERGRRTILLTTHFLDEADLLADRIAILAHGSLKASGTSVELKQNLGLGYKIHVHNSPGSAEHHVYGDELHVKYDGETVYLPGSPENTRRLLRRLDADGITEYHFDGPTLEDVFLKIADEGYVDLTLKNGTDHFPQRQVTGESSASLVGATDNTQYSINSLQSGRRTSIFGQAKILFSKRFAVFRRNPMPYVAAIAIAIIAAGCSSIFLNGLTALTCDPDMASLKSNSDSTSPQTYRLVAGPEDELSQAALDMISQTPAGSVTLVNTLDQFYHEVQQQYAGLTPGGFFLGNKPTFAWRADGPLAFGHTVQNLISNEVLNISISSDYKVLAVAYAGSIGDLLIFETIFGLAMVVYPAFLGLYPSFEYLHGIRAMHYSNGVHALPLWLAYLGFDFLVTLFISGVSTIIFGAITNQWFHLEYLFTVLLLYGIASTLLSYALSLVAKSQLAVFATAAAMQAIMFLIFFIAYMATFTYTDPSDQSSTLNIIYFTIGLVSPVASLARSLYLAVNMYGIACRGRDFASYAGAIDVFGGPILYLMLQSLCLFGLLLWNDLGFSLRKLRQGPKPHRTDVDSYELELGTRNNRASAVKGNCLEITGLQKKFRRDFAVDDVSFSVPRGECFALLGPNGAGKTTCISMIQGDLSPSNDNAEISIDGTSMIRHRAQARSKLGVCPQIDPLDSMTVGEHLRFYAQIRGINNPNHNIDVLLNGLGLRQYVDRSASRLSGGNKRKLSLGIALMGNPTVLLLDEPSSGMDALSKRLMWRTLASVIPGRALVLTTHSMEEANALANRAGIIAGKMLAQGTTQELKMRYGDGYSIHLAHRNAPTPSERDMDRIRTWVRRQFHNLNSIDTSSMRHGQIRFEISVGDNGASVFLADVLETIEMAKAELGIEYYSVSRATLDQVFFSVLEEHNRGEDNH